VVEQIVQQRVPAGGRELVTAVAQQLHRPRDRGGRPAQGVEVPLERLAELATFVGQRARLLVGAVEA
jgi:hypothetical protein